MKGETAKRCGASEDAPGLYRIGELAKVAGVSVRMLRHYDALGLLNPCGATQAGYRLYDASALARLRRIRYLRALDFSLADIARMLRGAREDERTALLRHRELMQQKRAEIDAILSRLDRAIAAEAIAETEETNMTQYETLKQQYALEARERWGGTEEYAESERRDAARTREEAQGVLEEMNAILRDFAEIRAIPPEDARAQALVTRLQEHITLRHYPCTDEILAGLGAMYVQDERFRKNIDRFGEGTAAFISRAIAAKGAP